jgi:predicted DsbA family dithiol-disulfide isomerase
MPTKLTFDFVSDVSCPWCIIGLRGLEIALDRVGDLVEPEIRFHPFELNPGMAAAGENVMEHVARKYGSPPDQLRANRASMKARAAELGFEINSADDSRIWNTFDAHRLLYWAALEGRQVELKKALFEAYFTRRLNPSDRGVLADAAEAVGLDRAMAAEILATGRYADEVRQEERRWLEEGVTGVPAIFINNKYVINGGQPPEAFERALRHIAREEAAGAATAA